MNKIKVSYDLANVVDAAKWIKGDVEKIVDEATFRTRELVEIGDDRVEDVVESFKERALSEITDAKKHLEALHSWIERVGNRKSKDQEK